MNNGFLPINYLGDEGGDGNADPDGEEISFVIFRMTLSMLVFSY